MTTAREIAESYWKAECERDIEKVLTHYHSNATFCPPGQVLVGHEQIRTFYDASRIDFPGLHVTINNDFTVGDQSALEWTATLTSAQGERFTIKGVNIVKIRDGKFEWVHAYFDPSPMQPKGK
ncbi:MAG: nuclear transport factor 2 family protein [Candidatus Nanopelagicaceae bacterium]|nr:nuclear transport factor 2 family protein [Candidatus Nanopelagicaceae bacterium]